MTQVDMPEPPDSYEEAEQEVRQHAEALERWIADGRPCHTGGGHHTEHADLCAGCLPLYPTAVPESLECTRPERRGDFSDGESMQCRHCFGFLCPGGHMHVAATLTLCPLC